jgi:hypothetical protein
MAALFVKIVSKSDVTIELPRNIIDSKGQDNSDFAAGSVVL